MYKTPSSRRRGRSSTKAPFTPRKKGLFEDGQWLCNCRKPAPFLLVKKAGPNKGKHFYTCDAKKCDFFLWEHDAQVREREALVTHNCRSENGIVGRVRAKDEPPTTPVFAPRQPPPQQPAAAAGAAGWGANASQDSDYLDYPDTEPEADETQHARAGPFSGGSRQTMQARSGPKSAAPLERVPDCPYHATTAAAAAAAAAATTTPSATRKRPVFLLPDSDEEFGGDDLGGSDIERELVAAEEQSVRKQLFRTPATARAVGRMGGGLPTPATRKKRNGLLVADEYGARGNKHQRFAGPESTPEDDETQSQSKSQSQSLPAGQGHALYIGTPTPYRKSDALAPSVFATSSSTVGDTVAPLKTPSGGGDYPKIADEVMALLAAQPVSEAARRGVRQALERHEMRVKGVVKGRDAARAALEARDRRIVELQARVVGLENARRFERARLRDLSDGLMSLSQEEV